MVSDASFDSDEETVLESEDSDERVTLSLGDMDGVVVRERVTVWELLGSTDSESDGLYDTSFEAESVFDVMV